MKYFSHDLDSRNDDKCFELIEIHGIGGYGFWWVILEELYKSESTGFQIEATKVWLKRLGRSVSIADERIIIRYFDTLADLGLISKQLWQEHIVYSEGVLKRADAYMIKRSNDAERKRVQRSKDAQKAESVPCDIPSVTRDISVTMPMSHGVTPTDTYAYADSYSNSNSNSEDQEIINTSKTDFCDRDNFDLQPEQTAITVSPEDSDQNFEVFREVWNRDRPKHWSECRTFNDARISALKKFTKQYGDRSIGIFQNALFYAQNDKWCQKPETVLTINNFLSNSKPFEWSEKYDSRQNNPASRGNTAEDYLSAIEHL